MPRLSYRPAIDGLRAFAVLSVLVFHLDHGLLRGGFVGVDVFFVISGYLITLVLQADLEKGAVGLVGFYQRRIARLVPAFFAVALATVTAAALLYSERDLARSGADLAAAAFSLTNLKVMLEGDYFEASMDGQPFLHYWSLAVEEQFYLLFPALLLILRKSSERLRIGILCLGGTASLLSSLWLTAANPTWAFYLLPTRAWELAAGAVLALLTQGSARLRLPSPPGWLPTLGLAAILLSFVVVDGTAGFPGFQALLPVAGTVGVLWPRAAPAPKGAVERLLSHPALVTIGLGSYSLYLWHWPVYSFVDYTLFLWPTPARLALKLVLTALLTVAGFFLIERPARTRIRRSTRPGRVFASLALVVLVSAGIGYGIRRHHYVTGSDGRDGVLVLNPKGDAGTVMLMGDSHGSMYGAKLRDAALAADRRLVVVSEAGGLPLPAPSGESSPLWELSLAAAAEQRPDALVLACAWSLKLKDGEAPLRQAIEQLRPHVGRIVLITQPPLQPLSSTRAALRRGVREPFHEKPDEARARREANEVVVGFGRPGVDILDIEPLFVRSDGTIRVFDDEGETLHQDSDHLSGLGAALVVAELLARLDPFAATAD